MKLFAAAQEDTSGLGLPFPSFFLQLLLKRRELQENCSQNIQNWLLSGKKWDCQEGGTISVG